MRHLQNIHEQYSDKGVAVIGVNLSDDREIAIAFLEENGATFPNALDTSTAARRAIDAYDSVGGQSAVPMNVVIDREGKIAAIWYGGSHEEGFEALRELGIR